MTTPDFTAAFGINAAYAERVYEQFRADPGAVPADWRRWFEAEFGAAPTNAAAPVAVAKTSATAAAATAADELQPLTGIAGRIATNMTASLAVPTATSVREVAAKVLEENRHIVNRHRLGLHLSKVSFTHLLAFALLQALRRVPALTHSFVLRDGVACVRRPRAVNLGLAIDLPGKDGARMLVVPNVKDAAAMDFAAFLAAYDDVVARARRGALVPADFADTTCTLTNPGTVGTDSSLPRLLPGQGCIVATGAITTPAAFQGATPETLTELGIARVLTLTSTYDHRVIQGADSGLMLDWMQRLLLGEDGFYEAIGRALEVPWRPVHFAADRAPPLGSSLREAHNLERAAGLATYIRSYRVRGHALAHLDPLGWQPRDLPELDMATYGLTIWDKERVFSSDGVTSKPFATLREIQEVLHHTYCRHVGAEYMHIADQEQRDWLRARMEGDRNEEPLPAAVQLRALDQLVAADAFERFLHTRFPGHKRFSIEGGETLLPVLEALLDHAGELGVQRVVLGMAHRGRLNVLAHVLEKPLAKIFAEFEGQLDPELTQGSGDVKYHLGASAERTTAGGHRIAIELASNPSHLEAVDPVVLGIARAHQEQLPQGSERTTVLPVIVHGDAAFAGQGVVYETLQMAALHGYRTGGTLHIVVNNQIGYTTVPADSRSTPYCTDLAKGAQAPIFHVNGDDPLAAVRMIRLCLAYRLRFQRDAVLDIVCYRRHGHNEGDEPSFTQPSLYRRIERQPTVRAQYQDFLIRSGVLQSADLASYEQQVQQQLAKALDAVRLAEPRPFVPPPPAAPREWTPSAPAVPLAALQDLQQRLLAWPADFTPHPKVLAILQRRSAMLDGSQPVDFATAETLAFATLLVAGVPVRLAGQDSGRGTFSQRHAVLHDHADDHRFVPLAHLATEQAWPVIVDSLLSEAAAVGFEYGYSVARPQALVLWEAQFGDFGNGAQIQIDQFLAAGEAKWQQRSGLVLLLPHGFDGQGPEHSSARLERYLQLCADDNLRVANPSTPASWFHLLRAQALDAERKPLIVLTPKSLLRQREAGSPAGALASGAFAPVLDDERFAATPERATRVLCCSGKVYYDLLAARGDLPIALVRCELLYPWPATAMATLRARYAQASWHWVQEEPANMGAWSHLRDRFAWHGVYSRRAAASPATGSLPQHKHEQQDLVARALAAD